MSGSPIIPPQRGAAGSAGALVFSSTVAELVVIETPAEGSYSEHVLAALPELQDGDRLEVEIGMIATATANIGAVGIGLTEGPGDPSPSTHRFLGVFNTDSYLTTLSAFYPASSLKWSGTVGVAGGTAYVVDGWAANSGRNLRQWNAAAEDANTSFPVFDGLGVAVTDTASSSRVANDAYLSFLLNADSAGDLTLGPVMVRVYR